MLSLSTSQVRDGVSTLAVADVDKLQEALIRLSIMIVTMIIQYRSR